MIIKNLNTVFHKHSKILFGVLTLIIIVSFIGFLTPGQFGCNNSAGGSQAIGEVYGKKVSRDDLQEFANRYGIFSRNDGDNPERLFYQYCLSVRADQLGIHVSDEEVARFMNDYFSTGRKKWQQKLADPNFRALLEQNRNNPVFVNIILAKAEQDAFAGSEYDPESYKVFADEMKKRGISEDDIAEAARLQVKLSKLREYVIAQVVVTPAEADDLYRYQNTKLHFLVAAASADKLPAPKKEALTEFFNKNKGNYRCVRVVEFPDGKYDDARNFCRAVDMQKDPASFDREAKNNGGKVSPVKWIDGNGEASDGTRLGKDLTVLLFDAQEGNPLTKPVVEKGKPVYVGCLVNAAGRNAVAEAKTLLENAWRTARALELAEQEAKRLNEVKDFAKREAAFRALKNNFTVTEEPPMPMSGVEYFAPSFAALREGEVIAYGGSLYFLKKRETPTGGVPEVRKAGAIQACRMIKGNAAWASFVEDLYSHCKFLVNKEEKR